jgi:uncharacterized protein YyaL (SSP411 family)
MFEGKWLHKAIDLTEVVRTEFWDEIDGRLYDVAKNRQELFLRPSNIADSSILHQVPPRPYCN